MITFSEAQVLAWVSPMMWPFLRVLALFTSAPIFSSKAFPARTRIALAFFVALAAQPFLETQAFISLNSPQAVGAVLQQVGVGLTLGFVIRLMLAAIELAGEVIGFQMGLNFASFFDPTLNTQTSAVAGFFGQTALFMFIVMNGHLLLLMGIINSFKAFPVDQNFLEAVKHMKVLNLGADLFASGLWIALPVVGMVMFVNLALGIVSRIAPQMNVFAIGFPMTLTVGLLGMAITLPMLDQPFLTLIERAIDIFAVV